MYNNSRFTNALCSTMFYPPSYVIHWCKKIAFVFVFKGGIYICISFTTYTWRAVLYRSHKWSHSELFTVNSCFYFFSFRDTLVRKTSCLHLVHYNIFLSTNSFYTSHYFKCDLLLCNDVQFYGTSFLRFIYIFMYVYTITEIMV